jgi:hypothetical protein
MGEMEPTLEEIVNVHKNFMNRMNFRVIMSYPNSGFFAEETGKEEGYNADKRTERRTGPGVPGEIRGQPLDGAGVGELLG